MLLDDFKITGVNGTHVCMVFEVSNLPPSTRLDSRRISAHTTSELSFPTPLPTPILYTVIQLYISTPFSGSWCESSQTHNPFKLPRNSYG